ncbi:MAG: oligosaccharide flippase family protein, partial [candidate division KSB1 bacterium]|nr:oligosaccharide flippase family protein [candidate division KSB1 bacterium]
FAKLFAFGGWVSVSQILTPLLVYVDRIFIGAFLSLSAVAYYTVQQEVLLRLLIIPQSIATTLYPAFSEHSARHPDGSQTERVYFRSLNYIILLMLPIVVVFFVYAENILRLWVGEEYAANSASVMQVFALGLFFNALAQIPFTALHAYGYPEVTAKFHLYELPLTVGLNLTLIPWLGIIGAALTWSTRVLVDTVLLFVFFHKHVGQSYQALTRHLPERSALVYSLPFVACLSALFVDHASIKLFVMAVFAVLYVLGIWVYGFDDTDRKFFFQLCAKMFRRF